MSLGDLNNADTDFKKFRLLCEDVQGRECLTNFHGMSFTRDKLCSIVRKWHTKIEAHTNCKTSDGYLIRVFCVGVTKRQKNQIRKQSYAQSSKIRAIRAKMVEHILSEMSGTDIKGIVKKLIAGSIEKDIERDCLFLHPLQDVYIRKIKIIKKPKFEHTRLAELHGGEGTAIADSGEVVSRPDNYEPPVVASV